MGSKTRDDKSPSTGDATRPASPKLPSRRPSLAEIRERIGQHGQARSSDHGPAKRRPKAAGPSVKPGDARPAGKRTAPGPAPEAKRTAEDGHHGLKRERSHDLRREHSHDGENERSHGPKHERTMRIVDGGHGGPHGMGPRRKKEGPGHGDHARRDFSERRRTGDLDRLTKGQIGRKARLADQFRMKEKGDVARRLHLHDRKHKPEHGRSGSHRRRRAHSDWHVHFHYCGPISPLYARSCFRFHYWGPSYYPSYCWYPTWCHWVDWSWHYRCSPVWDPRPVWCRPVVYVPAPRLIYYEVPVWTPLPEVVCGTWVDVEPVVVREEYDLQMLAIRFVDPGHFEEQLGPRYRVWFRNNSDQAIDEPFDVFVAASDDGNLDEDSPQAGVRVTSIDAGEVQSVDVRLPLDAQPAAAEVGPAALEMLHAVVDANRAISETAETNNGVTLPREEVLPVDPAAFELEPTTAPAGGEVVVAGEGFGPEPGQVLLHLGGIEMEAEILGWYDLGVRVALPDLPLAGATEAELIVIRGDGAAANPLTVTIDPAARDDVVPVPLLNPPEEK